MNDVALEQRRRTSAELSRWSAALLTAGAAAIHFAVTPEHFDEDWVFGVFFVAAAWAQLAWALLVAHSGERRLLISGIAGNVAIALVWVASRTTGLPVGPEPGAREPAGFDGVLATVFELLAALSIVLALGLRGRTMSQRRVAAMIAALTLVVIPLTTAAIATGTDHARTEQDTGRTHEKP